MAFDWTTFWFVTIFGLLLLLLGLTIVWYLSLSKRRKGEPSHIELYFDDNFRKIMNEWDLTSRDRAKEFRKEMKGRLDKVGNDIDHLDIRRKGLDKRLQNVESGMKRMEDL